MTTTTIVLPVRGRSVLVVTRFLSSVMLVLIVCSHLYAQDLDADASAVAVTVQIDVGPVVPGIFLGSRDSAATLTDGRFHFAEGGENVVILPPGSFWTVEDDPSFPGAGMAVAVRRQDESIAPGVFYGPPALAQALHESLAAERGVTAPPPSISLLLPESHSRVREIAPGTPVRVIASS